MPILINLLALALVVGISWFGMMWLAGRVHGKEELRRSMGRAADERPCRDCNGSGARHKMGKLTPCPVCQGTGTQNSALH